ncbi:MAG: carboxypeptidase regulatory-like domain-containing protein [Polymorphobacter sp.]
MTAVTIFAGVLALAVALAWLRLALWQRAAPARSRGWRLALLVLLQPLVAALLWLTLLPPRLPGSAGTLIVATAAAPQLAALAAGDALVALPEAPPLPGAARVPDLATALRRRPGTARLRIIGHGLPPRDITAATGLPLAFDPSPLPPGLTAISTPAPTAPGAAFMFGGSTSGLPGGRAELVDPGGAIVASAPLNAIGGFILSGKARIAGPADFTLRLRSSSNTLVETAAVPVLAIAETPPRLHIIAGAAGPDLKYLRRWAADAGVTVSASIAAGSALDIGDAPQRFEPTRLDLLVLDERSWATLSGGQRAAVLAAVRGGLGVLLRTSGPVPASVQRDWAALGLPVSGTTDPLRLPGSSAVAPPLTRFRTRGSSPDAVALLHDSAGNPVGNWRALGTGRIGLWPVSDAYALVLAGGADRHGALWSQVFAALARPQRALAATTPIMAIPGERAALCNLAAPASVTDPVGQVATLILDPVTPGCAAFWPRLPGWHLLRSGADAKTTPFLVTAPGPALVAAAARDATWRLQSAATDPALPSAAPGARGPSWPWFLGWLAASALLWWLERSRLGRR